MKTERLHLSAHLADAPGSLPSSGNETVGARRAEPTPFFVYFLQSQIAPKTYVGFTGQEHPSVRLLQHNQSSSSYTKKHKPWNLIGYMAVQTEQQARKLEEYFKTGAGRAFLSKYIMTKES